MRSDSQRPMNMRTEENGYAGERDPLNPPTVIHMPANRLRLGDILLNREFRIPFVILGLLGGSLIPAYDPIPEVIAILIGVVILIQESIARIRSAVWNLDYVAFLALVTALFFGEWLTGAVLALMIAVSAALDAFGTRRAEKTLRALFEKIPKEVFVCTAEGGSEARPIQKVARGDVFLVHTNEMIPLDGTIDSPEALLSEANLTGEMIPLAYQRHQAVKSGCVNLGEGILVRATGDFAHSSYRKLLALVEEGKRRPSPLIRLSQQYNYVFTLVTIALAGAAYHIFDSPERFLAVLVIATPCPLLIAVPVAFLGGLNKAARHNIVVKSPNILELLAKTKTIFFDKTGTLTLGTPALKRINMVTSELSEQGALALAAALEWGSLHPIGKALVAENQRREGRVLAASSVVEHVGDGVEGVIAATHYQITKARTPDTKGGMTVTLSSDGKALAHFSFDDVLKDDVADVFSYLRARGYRLGILTGDRKQNAERLFGHFGIPIYAECTPARKSELVARVQQEGNLVGMIGDGMNDAPALALADVGIVFSGTENSASIEAADVAILGHDAVQIRNAVHIGRRSYAVARESVLIGIGLSLMGMVAAFFGLIPPVYGAVLQEIIDAVVIVNALRSTY